MLRIVSKCSSLDEFVAIFKRFCDDTSIFIVTKTPKEVGARSRFLITLVGGEPMLTGMGEVIATYEDGSSPLGRPGMRLRFEDLDDNSRATLDALREARKRPARPPTPPPPLPRIPSKIPAIPGPPRDAGEKATSEAPREAEEAEEAEEAAKAEAAAVADAVEKKASEPPVETRAAGGSTILPANPFGDLTEESLEAFVECTMYEESGQLEAAPETGAPDSDPLVPAWWPKDTEDPTNVDGKPAPAEAPYPINSPAAAAAAPPAQQAMHAQHGAMPQQVPQQVPQSAPPMVPQQYGTSGAPRRYDPTELVPIYQPRPSWQKTAVVAGIASVLSLGIGYALWGGGTDDGRDELSRKEQPGEAKSAKPPAKSRRAALPAAKRQPATSKPAPKPKPPVEAPKPTTANDPDPSPVAAKPVAAKAAAAVEPVTPPAAAGSEPCSVAVVTKPPGAIITSGRKRLGKSPATVSAPCGPVSLRFNRIRYVVEQRSLTLVAGKTNRVVIRFKRPTHVLRVSSSPSGATAYVNGRRIGRTPTATKIKGYERASVRLTRKGYVSWSSKVYPRRKVHRVNSRLKRLRRRRR